MNIDIGGGTTKVVICRDGHVAELMAMDIGARLIATDPNGVITRLEPAGRDIANRLGQCIELGRVASPEHLRQLASYMVDHLLGEVSVGGSSAISHLLRTDTAARPIEHRRDHVFRRRLRVRLQPRRAHIWRPRSAPRAATPGARRRAERADSWIPPAGFAPPSLAPRNTPSRSRAAPSTCRRWTWSRCATFRW